MNIEILERCNTGDAGGLSFNTPSEAIDFVGCVADIHWAGAMPLWLAGGSSEPYDPAETAARRVV